MSIKRLFEKIYKLIIYSKKINCISTYKFNIKAFGWRIGLKFPVIIYGPFKCYNIGKIELKCPVKYGIVVIGSNQCDVPYSKTIINNEGIIEIYGKTYLSFGVRIKNKGKIIFSGNDIVSHGVSFDIREKLEIGENTSIGYMTVITDSNVHYTIDVTLRKIFRNSAPIKIGAYNWIGSYTHIKKGAIIPDYTIVSSPNAMICKDYSSIEPYSILAGSPAKVLKTGLRRVLNWENQRMINKFFNENPRCNVYDIADDINLDEFCRLS